MGHALYFRLYSFPSGSLTVLGTDHLSAVRGGSVAAVTEVTPSPSCLTAFCCGPYLFRRSHYIGGVKHQQVNFSLQSGQQALDLKAATIQIKLDSDLNKSVLKIFSHVFQRGGSTYRQFFFMQMQFI